MYQKLWGYKVEEKLYLGVREQKRLKPTGLDKPTGEGVGDVDKHKTLDYRATHLSLHEISDYILLKPASNLKRSEFTFT
jgi:hypothetical protein